jgi:hypothetical protein
MITEPNFSTVFDTACLMELIVDEIELEILSQILRELLCNADILFLAVSIALAKVEVMESLTLCTALEVLDLIELQIELTSFRNPLM